VEYNSCLGRHFPVPDIRVGAERSAWLLTIKPFTLDRKTLLDTRLINATAFSTHGADAKTLHINLRDQRRCKVDDQH
jgi:hypothetical protein